MKRNIGSYDKLIRLGISIVLIVFYYKQILSETMGIIALVLALGLTVTTLLSFSPIYSIFSMNTNKKEE